MIKIEMPEADGMYPSNLNCCPVCPKEEGKTRFLEIGKGKMDYCPNCGSYFAVLKTSEKMKQESDDWHQRMGTESPYETEAEFVDHLEKHQFLFGNRLSSNPSKTNEA